MTTLTENKLEQIKQDLLDLEHLSEGPEHIEQARATKRQIFFKLADLESEGGTVGEALAALAKQPGKDPLAATVLLRCLAIPRLVPDPNSTNNIIRSTNEICENTVPEIISYMRVDSHSQNHEKFAALANCHRKITDILDPLRAPYGDLEALVKTSAEITKCMSHSIVRLYCRPFLVKDVKSSVEFLIGKLRRVTTQDTTLLADVSECQRAISEARSELGAHATFLHRDFVAPFLTTCETLLASYLNTIRGKLELAPIV